MMTFLLLNIMVTLHKLILNQFLDNNGALSSATSVKVMDKQKIELPKNGASAQVS
jgi:hypothetical protein